MIATDLSAQKKKAKYPDRDMCYDVVSAKLRVKDGLDAEIEESKDEEPAIEKKSDSDEIKNRLTKREFMSTYRKLIEKDQLNDYLHMILIFTGAAQKASYPLEVLSNMASSSFIATLFKFLLQSSPVTKMSVLAILRNLIMVKVP